MLLIFPPLIMLLFIILIAFWNYDHYSDIRKSLRGCENVAPEPFVMEKQNFKMYGSSKSGKKKPS